MAPGVRRAALGCAAATAAVVAAVLAVVAVESPGETTTDPPAAGDVRGGPWLGTWGASVVEPEPDGTSARGFTDTTVRQVVHLSVGADTLRLRLSNTYGVRPLQLGRVTVAPLAGEPGSPRVRRSQLVDVTFDGDRATRVPPGRQAVSDPVGLSVADDSDLVVSVHLPGPTGPATWHPRAYSTSFTAPGDATGDAGGAYRPLDTSRYFLTGVDVLDPEALGTVVFVGDSITDGAHSSTDEDLRYPDLVSDRLLGGESIARCGVVNSGIGGNRLVRSTGTSGPPLPDRFERDVLDVPGVRTVVVLAGINDIGVTRGDVSARRLIGLHAGLVDRAHEVGLTVVGSTLLPFGGANYATPEGDAVRRQVNRWIRTSGAYDVVVDFDRVVGDEDRTSRIWPPYDSGDHLHPNDAGFKAMADAVPLDKIC